MTECEKKFRYNTTGQWFKGAPHIHTTASDGGMTISEIAGLYASVQYDFMFITDHRIASDVCRTETSTPLLLLDGIEVDGNDNTGMFFHAVCLGKICGITGEENFEEAMQKARAQGAILILAHPHACGNSLEDANRWNFDGVELYNHTSHWLKGKGDGGVYWEAMLGKNPATLGFASDDAHLSEGHPGWNGGWIVVNAHDLSENSILAAIKQGNFYSSCGPDFSSIEVDGRFINIECSPVQFVRLVGPATRGWRTGSFDGQLLTHASVEIPEGWDHMHIEIEGKDGKQAWSNTLFVSGQ
jgi:hypothetical protein